ncbi:MAG: peroxidase-related enzyme [Steroidobacteraceae bacterium]
MNDGRRTTTDDPAQVSGGGYPSQPTHLTALNLPVPPADSLPADLRKYFGVCQDKIGFVPNVLGAYAFDEAKLRAFIGFYNELMLEASPLTKLEREMVAVVVSAANRCYYCQVAHGQAVRQLSGDPALGELLVMNYRAAQLSARHRAMLDFAHKLTVSPDTVVEADREALRQAGFDDRAIWDVAAVAAFFNMTNRMATAIDMMPNPQYHAADR